MDTNYSNDEMEIDLKELFLVIKSKLVIILLTGLIGAVAAGLYSGFILKPVYTSSTMVYILNKATTITSLADMQLGTQLTKDFKVMVTSRPVIETVITNLELNTDYESLRSSVTVNNPTDTRILSISVVNGNPRMAKIIADEIAKVSAERIGEIMEMDPPKIIEEANVPKRKTSPSIKKYTIMGGIVGCCIAGCVVVMLFLMNDSIKNSEDVEKYLGLSTLGMIPLDENQEDDSKKNNRKRNRTWRKKSA